MNDGKKAFKASKHYHIETFKFSRACACSYDEIDPLNCMDEIYRDQEFCCRNNFIYQLASNAIKGIKKDLEW